MPAKTNFDKWLDGVTGVEEDHVFVPIGQQSEKLSELLVRRAALHPDEGIDLAALGLDEEERSLTEPAKGYTERRDELDEQIAAQLEKDHPDAPRIRLRGLSDEDFEQVMDELADLKLERAKTRKPLTDQQVIVEANLRYVSRAVLTPPMTVGNVKLLRRKLNRGEWARLLDHMNRLTSVDAEQVTRPN